jgi:hypothetical protein
MTATLEPFFSPRLSRQTIIIAADILKSLGHTGFDLLLLEYGIPNLEAGRNLGGLLARATALANYAVINPAVKTAEGEPIADAIVNRARQILDETKASPEERGKFDAALARDGFPVPHRPPVKEAPTSGSAHAEKTGAMNQGMNNRIFIVHGHDDGARETVARFLEKIGIEAVILHEQPNQGRTIIEKVEAHGDVRFAIVLLTPDDEGCKAGAYYNRAPVRMCCWSLDISSADLAVQVSAP